MKMKNLALSLLVLSSISLAAQNDSSKVKNGNVVEYTADNHIRSLIEYKDGKKEGIGLFFTNQGLLVIEEHYHDGKKSGPHRQYENYGRLREEGTYLNGKVHGIYIKYYENGNLQERATYSEGIKDGVCTWYYADG